MKVCLLSTTDGMAGGSFNATYRLHQGLLKNGLESQILVGIKTKNDENTIVELGTSKIDKAWSRGVATTLDLLPLVFYTQKKDLPYSIEWVPDKIAPKIADISPDIINLHWICQGYLQIETIVKFKAPLVWTLMDMWPFTGGCHYSQECIKYQLCCGACPQLDSNKDWDISSWVWKRKANSWKNLNLTIVSPSSWLADCARQSSLFKDKRIETIPFGLDTKIYKPIDRDFARQILNIPLDKKIVLFGAINATQDPRKGFDLLQRSLQNLNNSEKWQNKIELRIFGSSQIHKNLELEFPCFYFGRLYDDISLSLIYSAADVMIVPSTQEAFGQTASESLACGTPVVAFNNTGLKDIIDHQKNGYLAVPFDFTDMAAGIAWVLENSDRHKNLCFSARKKAEEQFNLELQAVRYQSLFEDILKQKK